MKISLSLFKASSNRGWEEEWGFQRLIHRVQGTTAYGLFHFESIWIFWWTQESLLGIGTKS